MKRLLAGLLSIVMVLSMNICPAFAADDGQQDAISSLSAMEVEGLSRLDGASADSADRVVVESLYDDDEIVTVIVQLDADSVLDSYDVQLFDASVSAGQAMADFLSSEEAQNESAVLLEEQALVLQQIQGLQPDSYSLHSVVSSSSVEVVAQWTKVTNAMAVKVPYGQLSAIRELDGVKNAYVQKVYSQPKLPVTEAGTAGYSYDLVGLSEVWSAGYTGEGMLIAVLDSGFDLEWATYSENGENVTGVRRVHEAFTEDSFKTEEAKLNVRWTESSMARFLENTQLAANTGSDGSIVIYDHNALYKNLKVPFAADYADGDANVRPDSSEHGTHVAGTIAGYAETEEGVVKFSGVAPDAQMLFMKVFDDAGTGAQEYAIINALEDAAILGADVMNLSLGSDNGFGNDDTLANEVYERLSEKGILFMLSAGNSYNSSYYNNYGDYNQASDPEISMIGAPSIYEDGLSIASSNSTVQSQSQLTWTDVDGTEHIIAFQDPNDVAMKYQFGSDEDLAIKIIPVDGYGTYSDYYNAGFRSYYGYGDQGVAGIALVKRGEISFSDKLNYASQFSWSYYNSAVGSYVTEKPIKAVLIYDDDPNSTEMIYMSVDGAYITSAFLNGVDGAALAEAAYAAKENGEYVTLKNVSMEDAVLSWSEGGKMSEFSSWGAGPALELKPEITAPGGNIWSSVFDNAYVAGSGTYSDYTGSYGMMSGTSMAAPHMSGITALVQQYVRTGLKVTGNENVSDLADNLMVSTAVPLTDEYGNYYSPRYQGAGLVSASGAIKTPAYITVEGERVGKIEFMDDPERTGSYDFTFTVHNLTNSAVSYDAKVVLMRPDTYEENGIVFMMDRNVVLETVSLGTVVVPANGSTEVSQLVTFTDASKAELDALFENGSYVEGFVILTNDTDPQIGLPFLAFYGDWTAAPIFDESVWVNEIGEADDGVDYLNLPSQWGVSMLGYFDGYGFWNYGQNPFDDTSLSEQGNYYQENVTISPNSLFLSVNDFLLYQKREAKLMVVEVTDYETGELYYRDWATYQFKTYYNGSYGVPIPSSQFYFTQTYWDGTNLDGVVLPSGTQCVMTITAYGDGEYPMTSGADQGYEGDISDFEAVYTGGEQPTFNGHEMDLTGDVISTLIRVDTEAPKLVNSVVSIYEEDGRTYITGTFQDDGSLASIEIVPQVKRTYKAGYGNPDYYEYGLDEINPFYTKLVYDAALREYTFVADVTEYAHINTSYSYENYYYDFEWTGNVYIFGGDYGGNDRAYAVTVNEKSTEEGLILSTSSALLYVGEYFDLNVINNTGSEEAVVRTSSNPEVATIDEFGHIEALAPGQTTITVSCGDVETVCIVAVRARNTEVVDFDLSIDNFSSLQPDGSIVVNVVNLQPADVVITESSWLVYENDPDWAGLVTVSKDSSTGLSGRISLSATHDDGEDPSLGGGYLEVTLNGVTRTMTFDWKELYEASTTDALISDAYYMDQSVYVEVGETATLVAKYRQTHSFVPVELYTMVGYQSYSYSNPTTPCTGLVLDGPTFATNGQEWRGKLVALPGYELPSEIKVCTRYDYGYESEMYLNSYYGGYTYDATTGEIVVKQAPYGATNTLVIRADGVETEGAPGGTSSGIEYTRPDGTYGPFDWTVTSGEADKLTTAEGVSLNNNTKNVAYYTPSEPGISFVRATSKDGLYSVDFVVVCEDHSVETVSISNAPDYLEVGTEHQLTAVLDPMPVLESNQAVTWTSYNPDVVTVDENGKLTAVGTGYAMITVASNFNATALDSIVVYVTMPAPAPTCTVTFNSMGGSAIASQIVENGMSASQPTAPYRAGYYFQGWYTSSSYQEMYDFTKPVTSDITLYAKWAYITMIPTPAPAPVVPSNPVQPEVGGDEGEDDVVEEIPVVEFVDVASGVYYYDAVLWAVKNEITKGTSDTSFSPDVVCTRAQAVTFLWRAAGSPKAKNTDMPFEDVAAGAYYYDAVLWAVENGITNGTSAVTFSPDADCSRAQIVTFLWRSQYSPVANGENPFGDVKESDYFYTAVLWAVENGITNGTSDVSFSPAMDCSRAQIVTFLYRCMNEA